MSMEHICRMESVAEIPRILAIYTEWPCADCPAPVQQAARTTIREFCEWWLSDEQRKAWKARTVIDGMQGKERNADAIFKFIQHDKDVSVFLILCQHANHYPHYQLQVPERGSLPQKIKNGPLLAEVKKIWAECDRQTRAFWVKSKKSIALVDRSESERWTIRDAIPALVKGLSDVYSRAFAP